MYLRPRPRARAPQLHQMLPPIMSILLSVPLGNAPAPSLTASTTSTYALRQKASDMLGTLMKTYGPDYETLIPRKRSQNLFH